MSRITKANDKYLARVHASIQREKNFNQQRRATHAADAAHENNQQENKREKYQQENNLNDKHRNIAISNDRYSDMWIASIGISVPSTINVITRGGDACILLNKLDMKVYNQSTKSVEHIHLMNLIKMLSEQNFPELKVSNRAQVKFRDLVIPAKAYFFIRHHWMMAVSAQSQYNLQTEMTSPNIVPSTITSVSATSSVPTHPSNGDNN